MADRIFCNLSNVHDLFEKVCFERKLINEKSSENDNTYTMFNLILTINHLFDWVMNDSQYKGKVACECIEQFHPYGKSQNFYKQKHGINHEPKINQKQKLVREISNKSKHFLMEKKFVTPEKAPRITAVAGNVCCGGYNAYAGYHDKYKFVIKGQKPGEKEIDLLNVCDDLISEWNNFLSQIK